MSDGELSEEGQELLGIVQEIMLMNAACRTLVDARSEALAELVRSNYGTRLRDTIASTPEDPRRFVDMRMREILDSKLATLADDSPTLVSAIARMLSDFLPSKGQ
jgi:hypothetical protein